MTLDEYQVIARQTVRNRSVVLASQNCVCINCLARFPAEAAQWECLRWTAETNDADTATCPECDCPRVIGDAFGPSVRDPAFTEAVAHAGSEASRNATTLWRPVGAEELRLIENAASAGFPPRLPEQPIFYPVTNEAYAIQIARDWNAKHNTDRRGYVTRFRVRNDFLAAYERKIVGGSEHEEYWIPSQDLEAFNAAIVGVVEVTAEFVGETQARAAT